MGQVDGNTTAEIIELMPETPPSTFRLSRRAKRHLRVMAIKLDKPESEIVETALTHMFATVEAGEGVKMTVDDDNDDGPKSHKKANSA